VISIGHKIISVVAGVVTLCLFAMGAFYIQHQEDSILAQNESTMMKLTESVGQGLKSLMLAGYADIARDFADRLEGIEDVDDFRIMRINGNQAFLDNETINDVNKRKGEEEFLRRDDEALVSVLPSEQPQLLEALESKQVVSYYEEVNGERFLTFLAPINNQEECHDCHDKEKAVRGVLKLTTSLAAVQEDIDSTWKLSVGVFAVSIVGIIFLTNLIISKTVINPLGVVTRAMQKATDGDLTSHVPVLGRDELSQMAASFNMMTEELERTYNGLISEQNKLATIILSAQEGIVVTDAGGACGRKAA
jgi:methyl-accepting chemotaxis protein